MEILIDGKEIIIKKIRGCKDTKVKLMALEKELEKISPRYKFLLNELKKEYVILTLDDSDVIYFLNFTHEEKVFFINNLDNLENLLVTFKLKDSYIVSIEKKYSFYDEVEYDYHVNIQEFKGFNLFEKDIDYILSKSMYRKLYFNSGSDYDIKLGYLIHTKGMQNHKSSVSKKLQLKDIAEFKSGIGFFVFKSYFKYLSETNNFIKDILEDYISDPIKISVPIDFKLLENAKNKKHLLELKTRKKGLFNRFNKVSLNFSCTILKILKHINQKELNKVISKEILVDGFEREKVNNFFFKYYKENITDFLGRDNILQDYIFMVRLLETKFNLDIATTKKLYKEHDRIAEVQRMEEYKKMDLKIKPSNPFLQLELPPEFKMLETKEEFLNEGKENNNCVFSYIPAVNEENCIIYTTIYKKKRYTIEFGKKRTQFVLRQIKGYGNSDAPGELIEYIRECIKDQRIVKKSNLKNEVIGA